MARTWARLEDSFRLAAVDGVPAGFEHFVDASQRLWLAEGKCCRLALRWRM